MIQLQGTTRKEKTTKIKEYTAYVAMVDVEMEIAKKGQIIYVGHVNKKGVHTNNIEQAAQVAYSDASKDMIAQINEIINN